MLNALDLTAERLGVGVLYDAEVVDLRIEDGVFLSAELKQLKPLAGPVRSASCKIVLDGRTSWTSPTWFRRRADRPGAPLI